MYKAVFKDFPVLARRRKGGFTLVELLIVILIMSVITAIAAPKISGDKLDAEIVAAKQSLRSITLKIDEHYHRYGSWPAAIDKTWFRGNLTPKSPWKVPHNGEAANVWGMSTYYHPQAKVTEGHDYPFYYNPLTGAFRIRVPMQATTQETIALYNDVNSTFITSLEQTGL